MNQRLYLRLQSLPRTGGPDRLLLAAAGFLLILGGLGTFGGTLRGRPC